MGEVIRVPVVTKEIEIPGITKKAIFVSKKKRKKKKNKQKNNPTFSYDKLWCFISPYRKIVHYSGL